MAQKPVKKPGQPGTAGAPTGTNQAMATTLGQQPQSAAPGGRPTGSLIGENITSVAATSITNIDAAGTMQQAAGTPSPGAGNASR